MPPSDLTVTTVKVKKRVSEAEENWIPFDASDNTDSVETMTECPELVRHCSSADESVVEAHDPFDDSFRYETTSAASTSDSPSVYTEDYEDQQSNSSQGGLGAEQEFFVWGDTVEYFLQTQHPSDDDDEDSDYAPSSDDGSSNPE